MWTYLTRVLQILASNRTYTQRAAALEAGVHEDVVSRWNRLPGFNAWMREQLLGDADRAWPLAVARGMRRGIATGDPREIEIMGRITGNLTMAVPVLPPGTDGALGLAGVGMVMNFLVPRPATPDARQP